MSSLDTFAMSIPELASKPASELIDYFVYYLTVITEAPSARPVDIGRCFTDLRIPPYSNVGSYLTRKTAKGKGSKFLKVKDGYVLNRNTQLEIQRNLHTGPARVETSLLLRHLLPDVSNLQEQNFLLEAIDCYEIGARRAAIVMVWILTVDHLCKYTFEKHLEAFNSILEKNTDKRIKISNINKADDFSEIPEGKLIEFLRQAKIISSDVKKILDVKLGIRNTSAHPSAVSISEVKATDFIIDLVENIIVKYAR